MFASHMLSVAEENNHYAQVEREALGIIFGVKRFSRYLYGREFILVTDHCPLCKLFGHADGVCPVAAAHMQQWALILGVYSYKLNILQIQPIHVRIVCLVFQCQVPKSSS